MSTETVQKEGIVLTPTFSEGMLPEGTPIQFQGPGDGKSFSGLVSSFDCFELQVLYIDEFGDEKYRDIFIKDVLDGSVSLKFLCC